MSCDKQGLYAHLKSGLTTTCRCWAIRRKDGREYGFTDHDMKLSFEGIDFKASTGLTASVIEQATGLSIDNSEAMGALSDAAVTEEDIEAGRFDGAEVRAWLVNWAKPEQRILQFKGSIGEMRRAGGAFHAELRGLTDLLNRPLGRIYQKPCTAVLGDGFCNFNLNAPSYHAEAEVVSLISHAVLQVKGAEAPNSAWFKHGRVDVVSGQAQGLWAPIKADERLVGGRNITLWSGITGGLAVGDRVKLTAGCDKSMDACRNKFNNFINFQGFPDLPGEDWMMAVPKQSNPNTGGSRR
ncbi:MAG: DUF2163 domain-containing protein [Ruegeria sp.]|nr:DUF2163 domain-containing protein [Ruegeria sp.]